MSHLRFERIVLVGNNRRVVAMVVRLVVVLAVAASGYLVWSAVTPSPAQSHIEAGFTLASRGDSASARREWLLATHSDPASEQAWTLLGQSYYDSGQIGKAREAFESALQSAPSARNIHSMAGVCAFRMGDMAGAERHAHAELSRNANDVPALETAAAIESKRGDVNARIGFLERLSRVRPKDMEVLRSLASGLYTQKRMAELVRVTNTILAIDPLDSGALALRGEARFASDSSTGGLVGSQDDLQRAVRIDPSRFMAQLTLGRVLAKRRAWGGAIGAFNRAARIRPETAMVWYELAAAWQEKGDSSRAAAARARYRVVAAAEDRYVARQKIADASPMDFAANLQAGILAQQRRDQDSARLYLSRAVSLRPRDAAAISAMRRLERESTADAQSIPPLAR